MAGGSKEIFVVKDQHSTPAGIAPVDWAGPKIRQKARKIAAHMLEAELSDDDLEWAADWLFGEVNLQYRHTIPTPGTDLVFEITDSSKTRNPTSGWTRTRAVLADAVLADLPEGFFKTFNLLAAVRVHKLQSFARRLPALEHERNLLGADFYGDLREQYPAAASDDPTAQPAPEIRETFEPSDQLLSYVHEALENLRAEVSDRHIIPDDFSDIGQHLLQREISLPDLRGKIISLTKQLIANYAIRAAEGNQREVTLSRNGRFTLEMQRHILSSLPIVPDQAGRFLRQLHEELVPVARSGQFTGRWGVMAMDSTGGLVLRLTPTRRRRRNYDGRTRATLKIG